MKILLANKFHYLKDGASRSYFETARLLEAAGHEVAFLSMRHPDNRPTPWDQYFIDRVDYNNPRQPWWKKVVMAAKMIYNWEANAQLQKLIDDFQPDVAHLHIIYHQLSPSIIRVLKKNNIPVVMTLHDYKVICPNYSVFHHGATSWRGCGGKYWQVAWDRAIKGSYIKSALAALEAYVHVKWLKTYQLVDQYIAPSQFMKDTCVRFGVPAEKIVVIPHAVPQPPALAAPSAMTLPETYVLYAGRLSPEKGVQTLLEAVPLLPAAVQVVIAGDGPERPRLDRYVAEHGLAERVQFTGNLDDAPLDYAMRNARALVIPSVWPEVFGYVALEAFARGTAVVAARTGGLTELIKNGENGYLFDPGNASDLADKVQKLLQKDGRHQGSSMDKKMENYAEVSHISAINKIYRATVDKPLTKSSE